MIAELEFSSGLSIGPIAEESLYDLAGALITKRAVPPAPADLAFELGGALGPAVMGRFHGALWAMVAGAGEPDASIAQKLRTVAQRRVSPILLGAGCSVIEWWEKQQPRPRAVCVVGTQIPWRELEQLQQAGVLVGRLPFHDPERAARWAVGATARWLRKPELPRRAWIVAPANDKFTLRLANYTVCRLQRALKDLSFGDDALAMPASDDEVGLVILLVHGREAPADGDPCVAPETRARVLAAARNGAVILHLGCHGAGRTAGGRYGDLPVVLGAEQATIATRDTVSPFAMECVEAGATAVIGHLDGTWSKTLEDPEVLIQLVDGIARGSITVGVATRLLADEANRRAATAMAHVFAASQGEAGEQWRREAGKQWLRFLDLSGFVCIGDPCAFVRWQPRGTAGRSRRDVHRR